MRFHTDDGQPATGILVDGEFYSAASVLRERDNDAEARLMIRFLGVWAESRGNWPLAASLYGTAKERDDADGAS